MNTENTAAAVKPAFRGYAAKMTNAKGETYPVYVVNGTDTAKFKDGTTGRALKVREGYRYLVANGHRYATAYLAESFWVRAERVHN